MPDLLCQYNTILTPKLVCTCELFKHKNRTSLPLHGFCLIFITHAPNKHGIVYIQRMLMFVLKSLFSPPELMMKVAKKWDTSPLSHFCREWHMVPVPSVADKHRSHKQQLLFEISFASVLRLASRLNFKLHQNMVAKKN